MKTTQLYLIGKIVVKVSDKEKPRSIAGPILAVYLAAINARNHLPFFKTFSNFVHFCPNFLNISSFFYPV